MTAKEYLSQALWTQRRIAELNQEIQRLRELACSVTGVSGERPGSGPGDHVGQAAAEIVYLEDMLAEETKLYSGLYREITAAIDNVGDARYREILRRRYVRGEKWEQIAVGMNYSCRRVAQLHRLALRAVEKRLH